MFKTFKYRIYPTLKQAEKIEKTFGVCRFLYNLALETRIAAWKSARINLNANDLQKQITQLKKDYDWMREPDADAINECIQNMDLAYKNFFKGGGFPKFKKKSGRQSYKVPHPPKRAVDFSSGTISVWKNHNIKAVFSRTFSGEIRYLTISKSTTNKYFVSVLVDTNQHRDAPQNKNEAIGIDLGLSHFAVLSTGEKIANPRFLKANIHRLKILQRRAAKKKRGSRNREKANRRISIIQECIANQRRDFLHKISTTIIRDSQADIICVESLPIRNMLKNSSLASAISDVSWADFISKLEYKAHWYGKTIVKVDRFFPSSKTCSKCGTVVAGMPLSVREWTCQCGAVHDRDINAAINIKNSGLGKAGAPVEQSAMKGCDETGKSIDYVKP